MTEQDNKGVTVLSEDNGEISDAQRREINEAVSWLNNWIEKRHQRGFMSDAEYEKAHKKLQNLIVATKDEAYDFAGGMRASGYFSITDDNEKITINRKEYPVDNVIHVSRNADNLGSRVVHEATHALRLEDSEKACTPEKVQSYYMDDKREIYARVMETRYNFNLDPQAKLSKENLRYLRETELGPEALAREKEQAERDREFDAMLRELTGETPLPEAQAEEKEEVSPVKPQTTGSRRSEQKTFILDSYSEDEKLKFFNDTADNGRANEDMNGLHAAMAANHSAISERIAAFPPQQRKRSTGKYCGRHAGRQSAAAAKTAGTGGNDRQQFGDALSAFCRQALPLRRHCRRRGRPAPASGGSGKGFPFFGRGQADGFQIFGAAQIHELFP